MAWPLLPRWMRWWAWPAMARRARRAMSGRSDLAPLSIEQVPAGQASMLADRKTVGHAGDVVGHGTMPVRGLREAFGHLPRLVEVGGKELLHHLLGPVGGVH